jgi:hypothetical protein
VVELATQPHDAELHPFRTHPHRVVPGELEQLFGGQGLPWMPDQREQQPVFCRRQRDRRAAHADFARFQLHLKQAVVEYLGLRLAGPGPPQQRFHPGRQLVVGKRLGQVVIGPVVQPAYLLGLVSVCGQDEDRDIAQVPDPLEHRPPVQRGQPDVQDDQVRAGDVKGAQALLAVG